MYIRTMDIDTIILTPELRTHLDALLRDRKYWEGGLTNSLDHDFYITLLANTPDGTDLMGTDNDLLDVLEYFMVDPNHLP